MGDQEEDDRFAHDLAQAQQAAGQDGDMDSYARVLSGRLRQMDKRARSANTRADLLEIRCDGLEAALRRIEQWSSAYPLDFFPEPDWKRSEKVLKAAGLSLSRISASNMRHVVEGVGRIARGALNDAPNVPSPAVSAEEGEGR